MLEKLLTAIAALTEALIANTAAHGGKAAPAKKAADDEGDEKPAAKTTKTTKTTKASDDDGDEKPAAKNSKTKALSREDVTALMNKVKEDLGAPVAKKLIKDIGGVERLAEVDDDDLAALAKAAQKKLDDADDAGKGNGDDL